MLLSISLIISYQLDRYSARVPSLDIFKTSLQTLTCFSLGQILNKQLALTLSKIATFDF